MLENFVVMIKISYSYIMNNQTHLINQKFFLCLKIHNVMFLNFRSVPKSRLIFHCINTQKRLKH